MGAQEKRWCDLKKRENKNDNVTCHAKGKRLIDKNQIKFTHCELHTLHSRSSK